MARCTSKPKGSPSALYRICWSSGPCSLRLVVASHSGRPSSGRTRSAPCDCGTSCRGRRAPGWGSVPWRSPAGSRTRDDDATLRASTRARDAAYGRTVAATGRKSRTTKEQEEQAPVTAAVAPVALETLESLPAPLKKLATAPPSETESEDDDSEVGGAPSVNKTPATSPSGHSKSLLDVRTRSNTTDGEIQRRQATRPRSTSRNRSSTRGTVSRNINADVKESNRRVSRRRADTGMTSSTKHNERSRRATFASKQDALAASTRSSSDRVEDALRSDGYIYWSAGWCRAAATPTAPRPTELLEGDVKLLCMLIYKKIAYSATSNKHAIHVTACVYASPCLGPSALPHGRATKGMTSCRRSHQALGTGQRRAAVARPDPRRPEEPAAAPAAASRVERRAAAWSRWRTGPSHLRPSPSPARPEQRRQQQQPEHHHFRFKATCATMERTFATLSEVAEKQMPKKFTNMPEDVVNDIKADAKVILHETGCLVG
ncbi:hypothetical protein GQ600_13001 [Phytophthora cactorum]|nr:hypothetical protein GQ600_13001 [Phytophthora cactorum]